MCILKLTNDQRMTKLINVVHIVNIVRNIHIFLIYNVIY